MTVVKFQTHRLNLSHQIKDLDGNQHHEQEKSHMKQDEWIGLPRSDHPSLRLITRWNTNQQFTKFWNRNSPCFVAGGSIIHTLHCRYRWSLVLYKSVVGFRLNFRADRSLERYRKWFPWIVNKNCPSSNVNRLLALGITTKNKTKQNNW